MSATSRRLWDDTLEHVREAPATRGEVTAYLNKRLGTNWRLTRTQMESNGAREFRHKLTRRGDSYRFVSSPSQLGPAQA